MEYLQYRRYWNNARNRKKVLNLVINGIPSILKLLENLTENITSFKPYYKWNTFNTPQYHPVYYILVVLNLIINGIPSILGSIAWYSFDILGFKPYYKWNTFNTKYGNC